MRRSSLVVITILAGLLTIAGTASPARADLTDSQRKLVLDEGQAAFDVGTSLLNSNPAEAREAFARAATMWTQLLDEGIVNGALLYDVGNAWVQAGQLGKGIASYLRSEKYMPGDARLAENLSHARSLVSPQFAGDTPSALMQRWADSLAGISAWARTIVFATAWLVFWCLMLWRRTLPPTSWRWLAGGSLALSVLAGAAATLAVFETGGPTGVLIEDEVIVRKGDAETYSPRFDEPIHRGVEFRILEERPIWLHVEFPNGEEGWVPRKAAEVVLHPTPATSQA
ncbi:MAG: SH3 domain-containing protein [Phycisphaerales bacterium]|jgi:hypothetical protein|nr:SH3 domain-containing protein [Phycisphaerales bacterium]